jgi:predicted ester cyclase
LFDRGEQCLRKQAIVHAAGGRHSVVTEEQDSMNRDTARSLIAPFYDALNAPASKDVRALIEGVVSPDWRSFSGEELSKGREAFIQLAVGLGRLVPDLAWAIKQVVVDGDTIVVRSEASGTPAADFMGVPHSGKRFAIMTIDVHTVAEGKLVRAHHVEDWAEAFRQLKG